MSYDKLKKVTVLTLFPSKDDFRYIRIGNTYRNTSHAKVCDWELVEKFIQDTGVNTLYFGLNGDFEHTKCKILEHGQRIMHQRFVGGSTWADPIITTSESASTGYEVIKVIERDQYELQSRKCWK